MSYFAKYARGRGGYRIVIWTIFYAYIHKSHKIWPKNHWNPFWTSRLGGQNGLLGGSKRPFWPILWQIGHKIAIWIIFLHTAYVNKHSPLPSPSNSFLPPQKNNKKNTKDQFTSFICINMMKVIVLIILSCHLVHQCPLEPLKRTFWPPRGAVQNRFCEFSGYMQKKCLNHNCVSYLT